MDQKRSKWISPRAPLPRSRVFWFHTLLLLTFTLCLSACGSGPQRPAHGVPRGDTSFLVERLDYEVNEAREEHEIPSITVSVVDANGPLFERAYGAADVRRHVPATIDTPYRWGSNAKLFVLLSLLQLETRGLVELDAPLLQYLPELEIHPPPAHHPESATWKPSDVTLRRMLTHYSGLPNEYLPGFHSERPLTLAQVVAEANPLHAAFPVDLVHSYSNLAYALLGAVVERVSGQSFASYVRAHSFEPLAMDRASFEWTRELVQGVARSYDEKGSEKPLYRISMSPAGELTATTREMGRFATAILAGGQGARGLVVSPLALRASFERQNGDVPLAFDSKQALTWFKDTRSVKTFGHSVQHGGGLPGYHSAFVLLTDHELGVAVATNSDAGAGVVQHLAWRALALAIEVKTGREPVPPAPKRVQPRAAFPPREMQRWPGFYTTPFGDIEVRGEDDELRVQAFGRSLELKPLEGGGVGIFADFLGLWDVQPDPFAELRFSRLDVGSRKIVVQDDRAGKRLLAVAYQPVKASGSWLDRLGFYRLEAREGDWQFLRGVELHLGAAGQLALRPHFLQRVETAPESASLRPVSNDVAVSEGLGRNRGVRVSFDAFGKLHMNGLVFRREPGGSVAEPHRPRIRKGAPRGSGGVRWR